MTINKTKTITAYIAVGANLGARHHTIKAAIEMIAALEGVALKKQSTLIETEPVGGPEGQEMFLNGAVKIDTTLSGDDLLKAILNIEDQLGRGAH